MIDPDTPEYLRDRPGEGTLGRNAEQALVDAGWRILNGLHRSIARMPDDESRAQLLGLHTHFCRIWNEALDLRTPRA